MKIGDYVRTKGGQIHKITDLKGYYVNGTLVKEKQLVYIDNRNSGWNYWQFKELITNSSPNLIDLIKEGDLVNNHIVNQIFFDNQTIDKIMYLDLEGVNILVCNEDIKSIVAKEQLKSMEYRIGE